MKEVKERLTCTKCREVKETYSALVYSQGDLVCKDCKEENRSSDNRAFDRYINTRNNNNH